MYKRQSTDQATCSLSHFAEKQYKAKNNKFSKSHPESKLRSPHHICAICGQDLEQNTKGEDCIDLAISNRRRAWGIHGVCVKCWGPEPL